MKQWLSAMGLYSSKREFNYTIYSVVSKPLAPLCVSCVLVVLVVVVVVVMVVVVMVCVCVCARARVRACVRECV